MTEEKFQQILSDFNGATIEEMLRAVGTAVACAEPNEDAITSFGEMVRKWLIRHFEAQRQAKRSFVLRHAPFRVLPNALLQLVLAVGEDPFGTLRLSRVSRRWHTNAQKRNVWRRKIVWVDIALGNNFDWTLTFPQCDSKPCINVRSNAFATVDERSLTFGHIMRFLSMGSAVSVSLNGWYKPFV